MTKQPQFDAETVIADFLGDLYDGHPRVGRLDSTAYKRLRELAQVLIRDLRDQGINVSDRNLDAERSPEALEWRRLRRTGL